MVDLKQKLEAIVGQFLKDTGLEQSTTTHIGDRGGGGYISRLAAS